MTPGGRTPSHFIQFAKLLSEEDLNRVRDKFHEDIEFVLEEALRK